MPKPDKDGLAANAPFAYYCIECGLKIEGEPFQMSLAAYEDSCDPVYFCSRECWEGSEEFNTDNWPAPKQGD